jgi:phytoene synthase
MAPTTHSKLATVATVELTVKMANPVARLVRRAKSNFFWSFVFLDRPRRDAIFTAYAFARHSDDIVDDAPSLDVAQENLNEWRRELDACYTGSATHPITSALEETIARFPIPKTYFKRLIEGVEMDLTHDRYSSFEDLYGYCYRVASIVGLICIEIFGYRSPLARDYAERLGIALQLTNILRDVGEDAERGRIYLPLNEIKRFGYSEKELLEGQRTEAFQALMQFQAQRARRYYRGAGLALLPIDRRGMFAAEIMRRIYLRLLRRIEADKYDVFGKRATVATPVKIGIALRQFLASKVGL